MTISDRVTGGATIAIALAIGLIVVADAARQPHATAIPPDAISEEVAQPRIPPAPTASIATVVLPKPPPVAPAESAIAVTQPIAMAVAALAVSPMGPSPATPAAELEIVPISPAAALAPAKILSPAAEASPTMQPATRAPTPLLPLAPQASATRMAEPNAAPIPLIPSRAAPDPIRVVTPANPIPSGTATAVVTALAATNVSTPLDATAMQTPPAATIVPDAKTVAEGRALLRVLENGEGPGIEIAWPTSMPDRDRLFEILRSCFGMETAVMDGQGRLFHASGTPGKPWVLDLDRFSGFVREVAGTATHSEADEQRAISRYHGAVATGHLVRVFPRAVDASMMGGLKTLAGSRYANAQAVHAVYRLSDSGVGLTGITADGVAVPGEIRISPVRRC